MRKQYLECGKIVSTHGVRGELKIQPWCDGPEYICGFSTLYLDEKGEKPLKVLNCRTHKHMALLTVEGCNTLEEAASLRGKVLYINRKDDPDKDSCFVQDLLGMTVRDIDTGRDYGVITDVIETGANDVYTLRDAEGAQRLVPVIPQVVLERDMEQGLMLIRPLKGLFDDAN